MATININQTKLKCDGHLIDCYHLSPAEAFEQYNPLSHFGTAKAANMRGMHYMCLALRNLDLSGEISVDDMHKILCEMPGTPPLHMQKVHLYMKRPLTIPDWGDHHGIDGWKNWFARNYEPNAKYLNSKEFSEQCYAAEQHKRYDLPLTTRYKKLVTQFIFTEPLKSLTPEELKQEIQAETLFRPQDEAHDRTHVALQRLIRFLEGEGYDGFQYKNAYEDKGSISYIIFRPWQVFNALTPETKHEVPTLPPEQIAFLQAQEQKFFHPKPGVHSKLVSDRGPSPSERIKTYTESSLQRAQIKKTHTSR